MSSRTSTPPAEKVPRRLGDYEILTELATGGVATVFAARHAGDAGFERLVAIKRVHRHLLRDPDVFASLSDEARISALVRHPNVVATHEVLDQKGELCLVQEYVEGVSLALLHKRAIQRGQGGGDGLLPVEVVARIAVDFLRGLHAAHEAVDLRGAPLELVHRDVSPQNILVGADGVARLIDFGIARAEGRITETRGGILKGKLAYMAPEQVGEREVDRRADLFAAGVVLYELLAGGRPFDGTGDAESMARILAAEPDLTKIAARAPELSALVGRALAKDPADRWSTAEDLAEAIAAVRPPASDAAMRACVKDVAGEIIEERRESIREELGRFDEEGPSTPGVAKVGAHDPSGDHRPAVSPPPRRAPRLPALIAAFAAAAVVAVAVLRGGSAPSPASTSPAVPVVESASPMPPLSTPSSSAPAEAPAPPPSVVASWRPSSRPAGSRPVAPASAAPSSRPDLHANPYGP